MNSAIVVIVILLTGDNLLRLFNGEITKKRCARNIVVYGGAVTAGLYGAYAGEAIGKTIVNEIDTIMEDTFIYEVWDVLVLPDFGLAMGAFVGTIVGAVTPPAVIFFLLGGEIRNIFGNFNTSERETITKPNVTLGDAYKFLGLNYNATIGDINSTYRRLAKIYHPDKGGKKEDWHKLKECVAVIKLSKGEIFS